MPKVHFTSHHPDDLSEVASKLLEACQDARIFAFFGELGAGKTTLIKALCRELGVREPVTSPTFTLVHEYQGQDSVIYHFDFYRIRNEEEAIEIGFEDYLDSGAYNFIEWPEKVPHFLPPETVRVNLRALPDHSRSIELAY